MGSFLLSHRVLWAPFSILSEASEDVILKPSSSSITESTPVPQAASRTFLTLFSLMMFTRLIKEKPSNRAAKMGRAKCCQAIENSIAEDCFDVPNIEEIFHSTFTKETSGQSFPTSYEVPQVKKVPNEKSETSDKDKREISREETVKEEKTKEEAKDFLGPLRFLYMDGTNVIFIH